MSFYLLDHPPRSPQFYISRANPPTWAVSVHTSEGPTGPGSALNLARFIANRSDPGSYAVVVDSDTTVDLVPPLYTTFSVAASGYNSRTWAICLAGRSSELSPTDPNTLAMIDRAGRSIFDLWTLTGVDIPAALAWIGIDALNRCGLFCHGDVQPWDRTDAWSIHPDRPALDALLLEAIARHLPKPPTPPTPEEETVKRYLMRGNNAPEVYLVDAGLGWKWHIPAGQLKNVYYVVTTAGGGQIVTPPGAATIIVDDLVVWLADQAFVDAIPRTK